MADPIPLNFGTSSDPGRYGPDAGARHINCYVEPVVDNGKMPSLVAADGFTSFGTVSGGGRCRGLIEVGAYLYGVFGSLLAKIDSSGVATTIGGISGTSNVSMAHNDAATKQLAIVSDGGRFVCANDVLTEIADTDLPSPNSATFLNQRIIYGIPDGRFFWSAVDNATDINPLDYATAEGNPDGLLAVYAHMQEVWVFGAESIEVWVDTGNASATFRRQQGVVIPKGCIGRDTIAALDLNLLWVGDDGVVYMSQGYQFQRVSHFGVEEDIRATADKRTIEAYTFHMAGHAFYVLSTADWTWMFNRTTQTWSERTSYQLDRWRASKAVKFGDKVILGDYNTGTLYQLSRTAYDEAGTHLVWRARTPPVHAYPKRVAIDRLHMDFVTGVGLNSSDAHENAPQVGLRWSDDGGVTWSNQRLKSLGAIGSRTTRVVFDGLGTTGRSGRIFEVECSSPVVRSLMNAAIEGDIIGT